ncbi:hypothetical protein MAJ_10800, partial [Metarhizium majus ARSEF 297]
MKGLAFITAAVFAGQAFAMPPYSQQYKRAEDDNRREKLHEEAYGIWIKACPSLGMPSLYCMIHVWEQCAELYSETTGEIQNWRIRNKDDLKKFDADVKACMKLRDPATDAGLCYDKKLSGEDCQKYAKEFREKNKYILGIEQGDKPQEEQHPNKAYSREDVEKAVQEACDKRELTEGDCYKAKAQCIWACSRAGEVHRDCPRQQTVPTPDDIGVCVAKVEV